MVALTSNLPEAGYLWGMTNIAATLAADFLGARGWCCICITPQGASCTVTIGDINSRGEPGRRVWLDRKQAEKVVAAFFSRHQESDHRPRGDGLLVDADDAATEGMIRTIADSFGYGATDDAVVHGQLALVTNRIAAALERMKRDGSVKAWSVEYRTAREVARMCGTAFPAKYDLWLADRLRASIGAPAA
jgi:hypothetical protein